MPGAGPDRFLVYLRLASFTASSKVGDACIPGEQNMTRAVTQEASLGAGCPALTLVKTCGDIKCPINCEQTVRTHDGTNVVFSKKKSSF